MRYSSFSSDLARSRSAHTTPRFSSLAARSALLAIAIAGCGDDDGSALADAGARDAARLDSGRRDSGGGTDAGGSPDAGGLDATVVDGGSDSGPASCPEIDLESMLGTPVATGSTAGVTARETAECAGAEPSGAVRYSWTAPAAGTYVVDTFGSSFDTALILRGPSCTSAEIDCNDDEGSDVQSRVLVTATAGRVFTIVVTGYDSEEAGSFDLSISQPPPAESSCTDGVDEDRDDLVDCLDEDCGEDPGCVEVDCTNGADDDMDGLTDCEDFDCSADPTCREDCSDGTDDDGDGLADCSDPDCASHPDCVRPGRTCATILCGPGATCLECAAGPRCLPIGGMCPP
jgi:hypothetical protein